MTYEYTCYACNNTYISIDTDDWNDEKAIAEYDKLHPEIPKEIRDNDRVSICDDCFVEYKKWLSTLTDEEKKEMLLKHLQEELIKDSE